MGGVEDSGMCHDGEDLEIWDIRESTYESGYVTCEKEEIHMLKEKSYMDEGWITILDNVNL